MVLEIGKLVEPQYVLVLDAVVIPAGGSATHEKVAMMGFNGASVYVDSNGSVNVQAQFSPDGTNWFDSVNQGLTTAPTAVANAKKQFRALGVGKYIRVVCSESGGSASATVTAWIVLTEYQA